MRDDEIHYLLGGVATLLHLKYRWSFVEAHALSTIECLTILKRTADNVPCDTIAGQLHHEHEGQIPATECPLTPLPATTPPKPLYGLHMEIQSMSAIPQYVYLLVPIKGTEQIHGFTEVHTTLESAEANRSDLMTKYGYSECMITEHPVVQSYRVTNIKWDVDEDADGVSLPTETVVSVPLNEDPEDYITDWLSNWTGFCHKGYDFKTRF